VSVFQRYNDTRNKKKSKRKEIREQCTTSKQPNTINNLKKKKTLLSIPFTLFFL